MAQTLLRLDTEIFVPQGAAFELREELFKARFAAPFVDFIVSPFQPGSCEFRYDLPNLRQQHSLRRLRPLSEFILLLDWAGTHNEKIEFEARVDSKPLVTGHIQVREALSRQVVDFATGIAQTWAVATHFNIQDTVQLAPIELRGQEEQITIIASVVGPSGPRVRIVHWCSDCLPSDEKPMYVPYVTDALIGQYRVAIAAAFIGQPKATGNIANEENDRLREFEIETRDLRLCRQCLCARDEVPRYTLSDLAQSVVKKYDESHHLLVAEGINDHLFHSQQRGKSNDTGGRACC